MASASVARAETLTWQIRSEHPKVVSLEFYSQGRSVSWPGDGQVYVIKDYDTHTYRLSCRPGEQICYGAWVRNRKRSYWGVGANNRNRCRSCCYTCDGGETQVIVLNP
ncbi:hypothetical protein D1F64_02345 [Breoghania sp. L-A4]|nr:hypothetical protein D1F64_02345 [Breoghania sp. L-A4]